MTVSIHIDQRWRISKPQLTRQPIGRAANSMGAATDIVSFFFFFFEFLIVKIFSTLRKIIAAVLVYLFRKSKTGLTQCVCTYFVYYEHTMTLTYAQYEPTPQQAHRVHCQHGSSH